LCNNPGRKLSTPGSGIAASPHEVRDLQIVNTAHLGQGSNDDNDYQSNEDEEGSGYDDYDYGGFLDEDQEDDYGPESEDQTEPPLFITEESDLYKRPTAPPIGDKDDFGFVEDPNAKVNFEQTQFNTQLHKNPNAKSSQHQTVRNPDHHQENSSTNLHHKSHTSWSLLASLITFKLILLTL